ncbi:MAG: VanZ family protein [Gammaproteobacteria bacterium]|nr:MAG: VanZ family protein [Gammaproteobacteria bacterium]
MKRVLPLRYRWWWFGAGLGALALIMVLALLPLAAPVAVQGIDKFMHFLAFTFLTIWFLGVFEARYAWLVAAGLLAYGGLIELLQSLTSFRFAEANDVVSNLAGIGAGWLLSMAGLRHWCRRIETMIGVVPQDGRR